MDWTISAVLKQGFHLWKQRWGSWILALLLTIALPLLPHFASKFVSEDATLSLLIFMLIGFVLSIIADMGFTTLVLKAVRGESWDISDYFSKLHLFPSYFVAWVLYQLSVGLGLVLLLIPGIFMAVRLSLYRFCVLDQGVPGLEALKTSNALVKGCSWRLLGFWALSLFLIILSVFALILGAFVMIPIINLAWASIYLNRIQPRGE